jgi:hypothetical protein
MFDVSGKTNEAEAFANSQKAMLVTAFEDMKIQFELDKAIMILWKPVIVFCLLDGKLKQSKSDARKLFRKKFLTA